MNQKACSRVNFESHICTWYFENTEISWMEFPSARLLTSISTHTIYKCNKCSFYSQPHSSSLTASADRYNETLTNAYLHSTYFRLRSFRSASHVCYVLALFERNLPRHSWIRNQQRHAQTNQWRPRHSHLAISPPPPYSPYDYSKQS